MNTYDRGDLVRLTGTFRDAAGTLADPTTITLRVKDPSGIVSTPATIKEAVGVYRYDLSLNLIGTWRYRYEGTGTVQQSAESALLVRESAFYTS